MSSSTTTCRAAEGSSSPKRAHGQVSSSCTVTSSTKSMSRSRSRAATRSSTSRRTRTFAMASTTLDVTSSRTPSQRPSCSRRCERRRPPHRVRVDRLDLRRARGLPYTRDVPLPGADVALRRLEAGGRGSHPGVCTRVRLRRGDLPLRLDPRRALHARARLRLLPQPPQGSVAPARARRRSAGEVVSLRRRLRLGDEARDGTTAPSRDGHGLQPRHRRDHRGRRLDRDDHRPPRRHARDRVHRRRPRVGRRQPAHPPRLRAHSLAGLATNVVHSRGNRTDGRLARAEPDLLDERPAA